ncbi:triose-phosphate isomerase [Candidatus Woesearchaeota archaeon]|nr:triose-phosphate isomerase [Candidatus Woesearchaeota archaeon]
MTRKPLIAGNWKMNKTIGEAISYVKELREFVEDIHNREIVVCPPFTALSAVGAEIKTSNIALGAQDVYWEKKGSFTSAVSAEMLKEIGVKYVIIGHSERRQFFDETNETVNKKVKAALENGLTPIVCIGESEEEREDEETENVIEEQLKNGLMDLTKEQFLRLVIAYEPVWAIGTGKNATPEEAEEAHIFIRKLIAEMFDEETASSIRILYGGSVKPDIIKELMAKENIDGALVGGASLDARQFSDIIKF